MPLPTPESSRAVLIGASEYEVLEALPAVANNLERLAGLLTDRSLWGLPSDHVAILHNPATRDEVLDAVHRAAAAAEDAILVYFAGHGLPEYPSFALHLALPSAGPDRLYRALPYNELRREITKTCQARHKVVILDCCYSGRAMDGFMASSLEVADQAQIEGTYLMTASAETVPALAVPGEEFTAFTGELIRAAELGVAQGPDLLDMGTLYFEIRANLLAKQRPEPQERARNDGRSIALLRNRRGGGRASATVTGLVDSHRRPLMPTGYESLLRHPPREVLDTIRSLRDDEQTEIADRLLAAVIGNRTGQEVAATLRLLSQSGRDADSAVALRAAALRPPDEIGALLSVLRELEEFAIIQALLAAVAVSPAGQVVAVSALLKAESRSEEARALLNAAAAGRPGIGPTIELIAALWAAHRPDEIDRLLATVAARISPAETLELADALRTTGREETAFGLYVRASAALTRRSPDQFASVLHAMRASGWEAEVQALTDEAVRARKTAEEVMYLAEAIWAAGHDDLAIQVIEGGAGLISEDDVIVLLKMLYSSGHSDAMDRCCGSASTRRSSSLIANLVDTLHDLGRPVSANRLLAALGTGPPELTVELVQTFAVSGRRRDVTTLLDSVLRADADHQASLIATWVFGSWGPRVISGMRTAVRHFIQQQFANPKTLLTMLTLEIGTDELVVELLDTMFPDFNKAISGYQVLDGTPGCEHIADQLLSRQRDKVVGMDTAIDLSLALVSAKDAQLGKRFALKGLSVPDRPGPLDPPQNLMIAYRVVRGTSVVSAPSETQQIGAQFLDEHIVAVLAVLRTRDLARTRKLLHVVAQHRPVEAVPSAIAAPEAAGLTREMKILMQALRERPKRDVRRLARLLKESHPDLATELLTTS